jgi:N-acetylneuraminate synthase
MKHVYVIAEAGVNHNGSYELAKQLIDVAKKAGVDAVKFQTWKTELLIDKKTEKADYQKTSTGQGESQFDMLKNLELSYDEFVQLKQYCDEVHVEFLSTPDESESAQFLDGLQQRFKIGSGELTNIPFLRQLASFDKPVILSSGMANIEEIELAVTTLINAGLDKTRITVLHANTEYPTPDHDANLLAMQTIKKELSIDVGYSDHTLGIEAAVAATALGATVIEKHFTLDRTMAGPDHSASLEPGELENLVVAVRRIEQMLGDGVKQETVSESKNKKLVRKSIVANGLIEEGMVFTATNLTTRRPLNGIGAEHWDELIGTNATKKYSDGDLIVR